MILLGGFILFLGNDISSCIERLKNLSNKISSGDLREIETVWSDDELGDVADHLRETFYYLRKMQKRIKTRRGNC